MSESQSTETDLSPGELNTLVNDTALYILHDERPFNVIKRQDIVKLILKEKKRHFLNVIQRVKALLIETLNLELVDVEPNKQYVLVNRLHSKANIFPSEVEADRTLLILILTLIFMNNGVMGEGALYDVLKHLKMLNSKQDKKHEFFGDVEAAVKKKYVRWGFLDLSPIPGTDPPEYQFRWGNRAEEEVRKEDLLDFACQVIGDTEPRNWERQYEEAQKQKEMKK